MNLRIIARVAFVGLAAAEAGFAMQRWQRRRTSFAAAARRALDLGRPLVVVGDPHAGAHTSLMPAYGCGDLCIDLRGCPRCESYRAADITRGPIAGIADDSAVVFVSCVFEYVDNLEAARREILRIAGDPANVFAVTVQPWTLTAALYPGARWTGTSPDSMRPVTRGHKIGAAASITTLLVTSVLPQRKRVLP